MNQPEIKPIIDKAKILIEALPRSKVLLENRRYQIWR